MIDEIRCQCGILLFKITDDGIEVVCHKSHCHRFLKIPLPYKGYKSHKVLAIEQSMLY